MDDHTSSDRDASSDAFTLSRKSSNPSTDLHRPQPTRQSTDTHVFPANPNDFNKGFLRQGENSAKARAALRELLHPTLSSVGSDERTRPFNSGLQWLLENSTAPRTLKPLSHEAVGTFNSENERGGTVNTSHGAGSGSRSTRA